MKILYFVEKFLSPSETFIKYQIKWFSERHDVFVLCTKTHENYNKAYQVKCIPFKKTFRNKISKKISYLSSSNASFSKSANEYIQKCNPDIIHCHFGIQALTLLDNLKKNDKPVFITFHGYDTLSFLSRSLFYRRKWKRLFKKKNIYPIFVCKYHKNIFSGYSINSKNSTVLYNGVYPESFQRNLYVQNNSFIQISRFTEKKGHLFTIKAFELFHKNHKHIPFKISFVGDGSLKEEIVSYLENSPIRSFVEMLNWASHEQIPHLLNNHKFYVQHSITADNFDIEATSISILEAMSMEMPVLTSNHAGIPETVEHNVHGLLCDEKDIETFADQIFKIISWSYLKNNRKHILKNFNLIKRNQNLEEHYKKSLVLP